MLVIQLWSFQLTPVSEGRLEPPTVLSSVLTLLYHVLIGLSITKEPLNKSRLTAQYVSCLHIFPHLAQKFLDRRQPACEISIQSDEKSDCAIYALDLISASLNLKPESFFLILKKCFHEKFFNLFTFA